MPVTVPLLFTATETFDIGTDLGSPVSLDYAERAPFAFDGTIHQVHINIRPRSAPATSTLSFPIRKAARSWSDGSSTQVIGRRPPSFSCRRPLDGWDDRSCRSIAIRR